jgi:hypothetical protein
MHDKEKINNIKGFKGHEHNNIYSASDKKGYLNL